jgi:signal transduction histidine kinase/DNA-binding response OmpR family regulator/HPt (histidine-containing phosphotransfer) domain-containing protein
MSDIYPNTAHSGRMPVLGATARHAILQANLGPSSVISQLPLSRCAVPPDTPTLHIFEIFDSEPGFAGVVIVANHRFLGMVSRDRLFEQLSRPSNGEHIMKKPILQVLESINVRERDDLVLAGECPVNDAARAALERPNDQIYEPIVVQVAPGRFRLLDIQTLLLAQSRLLELANTEIQRQKEAAEQASRAKSEFLTNMSHEIRTPLTAILGFADDLLDERYTPAEKAAGVLALKRNSEHLSQLVDDILDLSKIEAGRLQLEPTSTSPTQIVKDVISSLEGRATARGIKLSSSFPTSLPATIQTDPMRLKQILINLVGNAVKFTEQGYVELRVSATDRNAVDSLIKFEVIDTGIGLTSEQLSRMFVPFTQADGSTARRFGGTGLGLSISRRLARILGGEISATSTFGQGSTFIVKLPFSNPPQLDWITDPTTEADCELAPDPSINIRLVGNILLVEDGPDNQLLISRLLEKSGACVEIAENGVEALAYIARNDRPKIHAILMDMQMPVMDGFEATRRLREMGIKMPIIALTANAMGHDQEQCLKVGCNHFTTKPLKRLELLSILAQYLPVPSVTGSGSTRSTPPQLAAISAPAMKQNPAAEADRKSRQTVRLALAAFDVDAGLKRAGGDQALFIDVAQLVCEHAPKWLGELQAAIASGNATLAKRLAHSLKSSAENVGGAAAAIAARSIEVLAADGDLESAKASLASCHSTFQLMLNQLESYLANHPISKE